MPPPTSKVWKYFKRTKDSKNVKCQLCEVNLSYTGVTINMLNHIRLKHKEEFDRPETPEKQPTLSNFVKSPIHRKFSGKETDDITRVIVDMVVFDYMPLQMVEGKGFKKLMSIVAPNYNIPYRNTKKSRIEKVYEDRKSALLGELDRVDTVALASGPPTCKNLSSNLSLKS